MRAPLDHWSSVIGWAVTLLVIPLAAHAQEGDARDLMKRVRDAVPTAAFVARMTMTSDRGWNREVELSHKHLEGDVDASYMEVTAPMDLKDTRFLVFDHLNGRDEQFMYVPAAKRALQIGTQTRKQEFLGSEFYIGDLVQPDFDSFTYKFVGEETVGGRHCRLIESVAKTPADELYSKSIVAVDPTDLLIMRSQLFDEKGALQKVWTMEKVEKIDGYWTPMVQQMVNVPEKHWTRIEMKDVQYNAKLPDTIFNRSYLIR